MFSLSYSALYIYPTHSIGPVSGDHERHWAKLCHRLAGIPKQKSSCTTFSFERLYTHNNPLRTHTHTHHPTTKVHRRVTSAPGIVSKEEKNNKLERENKRNCVQFWWVGQVPAFGYIRSQVFPGSEKLYYGFQPKSSRRNSLPPYDLMHISQCPFDERGEKPTRHKSTSCRMTSADEAVSNSVCVNPFLSCCCCLCLLVSGVLSVCQNPGKEATKQVINCQSHLGCSRASRLPVWRSGCVSLLACAHDWHCKWWRSPSRIGCR